MPETFKGVFLIHFFKAEWESRTGTFVALGNKMYQGFDNATESTKKSTKGIPSRFNSTMDTWLSALLGRVQNFLKLVFFI